MTIDLTVLTRDEIKRRWLRDSSIRNPSADTGPGTEPDIAASVFADQMSAGYANAQRIAGNTTLDGMDDTALETELGYYGVGWPQAVGSQGFVEVTASSTGGNILAGDEAREPVTKLRFIAAISKSYDDGEDCQLIAVDTGPATNLAAGTRLNWSSPRPGIGASCVIVAQSNGEGFSGGRDKATGAEVKELIRSLRADPAASGNDAQIRQCVKRCPGLQVEEVFTFPCTLGPGSTGVCFTLKPAQPGASRIPNAVEIASAMAWLRGQMPGSDGLFPMLIIEVTHDLAFNLRWAAGAASWYDGAPWPAYFAVAPGAGSGRVRISAATDSTHFVIETSNADYTTCGDPAVGQTLGVFDRLHGVFKRKTIRSPVGGGGPWTIVCETLNAVSDIEYVPVVGQMVIPWSDSLDQLVVPIIAHFDGLGPGEQQVTFFDDGGRQRRYPLDPRYWPHDIGTRIFRGLYDLDQIQDINDLVGVPHACPVGVAGTQVNLLTLGDLGFFPE